MGLGAIHLVACTIFGIFLKETRGLSSSEKKALYTPKIKAEKQA
jgi:hypothetical protein